jgi:hypothetical protein
MRWARHSRNQWERGWRMEDGGWRLAEALNVEL